MSYKKRLHKNVFLLGVASLLNDISSEILAPLLPLIIKNIGGNGISMGLIGGFREGLSYSVKFIFGSLSDRYGKRKPFVFLGYFLSTLFKGALALATSWQQVFIFIGLERLGKGIRTAPRDVIVAQSSPQSVAKALGFIRSFDNIGATIGSLAIAIIMWLYKYDLQLIIICSAIIAVASLIPLYFVQEPRTAHHEQPHAKDIKNLSPRVKAFIIVNTLFHLGGINYMFLILRVHDLVSISSPVQNALLMYVTFNFINALCSMPMGGLIDTMNSRTGVALGYAAYGIVMLGFWAAQTPAQLWLMFALYGLALALTDTSQKTFALALAPASRQGTALGFLYTSLGLAQITGGLLAGVVWEYINHESIFLWSAGLAFLSLIALVSLTQPAQQDNHAR